MEIRFANKDEIKDITQLSQMFAEENCCNGIVADDEDYFVNKNIAVAIINGEIVGYGYGEIEISKTDKNYIKKDQKLFYLEEMYVIPQKRNLNLGQKIFIFLEKYAKEQGASAIGLSAVSKDYLKLLKFYIEKMGMTFFSAYLYKKI